MNHVKVTINVARITVWNNGDSIPFDIDGVFADLDNYTKELVWADDEDGDAIELTFDKMKIGERKYWLRAHQAGDSKKHVRYRDFINKEFFVFSNQISIPSIVDGLNLGQRKILFCAFKKPIIEAIQVSKFNGYVSVHSAYHHGNTSLVDTIIGMAQNYVGSNNINLLQPNGQFGTRLMIIQVPDIFSLTQLSPITRYIFHKADEHLLNYLNDDGQSIEPAWFIPIIPMILVNGGEGIGTGWSSFIPKYNPRDIIANLIRLLNGEAMVPMIPWYKWFKGRIRKEKSGYTTRGVIEEIEGENALKITELPVRMCTRKYEEILQAYTACNDAENVHFKITMTEDQMNTAKKEGLWKKFKLTTTLSTANMHLFDEDGVIKKYDTPEQNAAADNKHRDTKVTNIKVDIDVSNNWISVWTNTLYMDVVNATESFWGSSSSSESRLFLTEGVVETFDMNHDALYKRVFTRNECKHTKVDYKSMQSWTMVSFTPDLSKFGMDRLEEDTVSLMKRRVFDLAGCLGKGVKVVELAGTCALPRTFEDYVKLYLETSSIYEKVNDRLEICVGISDGHFEQVSFINNFATMNGGPHRCVLSAVGQVYYGMFPLRCKLPNVKRKSRKLEKNAQIQNFKKILGLEDGKTYKNVKELRYGHLLNKRKPKSLCSLIK
uniref:DNA topoisomerase (ATP-hydrolyzing) n=1 Tax=Tanacetum cinerariifolium TaxID=118510 RepID=A0A6L2LLD1_TANCI|nr:DNA topoisomerase 2 isoform X2 [Tanacetum cinerariifolium]